MRENERLEEMVKTQIAARGIRDTRVLEAFRSVPREQFIPERQRNAAYDDGPLPIGCGQTISQPYIVAFMSEQLRFTGDEKVLEVGTGSGYQAAILGRLAREVHTVEIVEAHFRRAHRTLKRLGYENVHCHYGDAYAGLPEESPFDRVLLTAAVVTPPPPLIEQLDFGGLLLFPQGRPEGYQELVLLEKTDAGGVKEHRLAGVRFVPMTGRALRE